MTFYYFGNSHVPQDQIAVDVVQQIRHLFPNHQFIHGDPTEQWQTGTTVHIIDTVIGLKKVTLFDTLESFQNATRTLSPHDYDLYMDLALMLKLKKIKSFRLIGIPETGSRKKYSEETAKIIRTIPV